MKEIQIRFNGGNIYYRDYGKGNTLVLLHGFTESQEIWNDFSEELSKDYRVITVDLPGHGKSDCIADVHTMELLADVVKAVLSHAEVKECVMVGHSMGGYVTLAFVEKFPETVRGFGLFHSSALADTPEAAENRTRAIELIRKNHTSFISSFIPDLFAECNREKFAKEIAKLVESAKKMTPEAIIAAQQGMKIRPDRLHVLKNASCPVLFILGKLDSRVPYDKAMQQAALPDDAVILSLGNIAHMGYIEARDKTLFALRAFLEGIY